MCVYVCVCVCERERERECCPKPRKQEVRLKFGRGPGIYACLSWLHVLDNEDQTPQLCKQPRADSWGHAASFRVPDATGQEPHPLRITSGFVVCILSAWHSWHPIHHLVLVTIKMLIIIFSPILSVADLITNRSTRKCGFLGVCACVRACICACVLARMGACVSVFVPALPTLTWIYAHVLLQHMLMKHFL